MRLIAWLLALLGISCAALADGRGASALLTSAERNWLVENQPRIVLAVETGYPPFVFLDPQGRPTGLAHDYLRLIEAKLGVEFRQRQLPNLEAIFAQVRAGEVQIVNAVTKTPEREAFLRFTEPFITVPNVILVRTDRPGSLSEADLAGLTVSLVRNYAITEHLLGKSLGLQADLVPDDLTALLNVSFARVDAAVVDLATASHLISQKGITNLRVAGETAMSIRLAIATPLDQPVLGDILQKGLAAIGAEEREAIRQRWITVTSPNPLTDLRVWLVVSGVLFLVFAAIAGVVIWNHVLRRQVRERTAALEASNLALQVDELRLNAMLKLSESASQMSERDLLQHGLEEAQRLTGSVIGYLHFINRDQETIELYTWSQDTLKLCTAAYDSHYPVKQAGIWADTVRFRRPVVHNDYPHMAGRYGIPEGHFPLLRHMAVPVMEGGQVRMIVGVGNKPSNYEDADVRELQLIGDSLWKIVSLQRALAALEKARDQAEAASRAKSTFLANMSHELRTPMNAIMGMTSLALRHAEDPKLRDQLQKIDAASKHLLHVINDILDISKIEAERLTLEHTDFRLGEILENLMSLIGHKASEKGLEVHIDLPAGLSARMFNGDPLRLEQILLNLAGNALKFTPSGSITLRARIITDKSEELLLRWEVQDTGIGISAADQLRLFTAFEQADGSLTRKYGGTGLGLAISKRLARMMGGEIGVESEPGRGSTFWFTVRLRKPAAGAAVFKAPATSLRAPDERLLDEHAGALILLAEDEPVNQEVSRGLLEDAGLAVDLAADGSEAVAMARQKRYDLILMDMQMPNLNGVDATLAIRRDSLNADTPILAMTANAFAEDRQTCLDAGMNDFVAKPVAPEHLYEALLRWLQPR
jgi:signal transduction histidine kinase/ABC-type amino acid transport substrate-binding protein/ActR/RegA family two-component response regulator